MNKPSFFSLHKPRRLMIYSTLMVIAVSAAALSIDPALKLAAGPKGTVNLTAKPAGKGNSEASKKAFLAAYKVLMSPRCMNCHPSGDTPLQGDDSHLHTQGVTRGIDGKGMYAMKCTNCHQPKNVSGLNMPPGNPNWHLPPADMKMVFQGKTPRQLAMQLKDPKLNGGKTLTQLIGHVTSDTLVLAGWHPAEGLKMPPLSHKEFARQFRTWIEEGAAIPDK